MALNIIATNNIIVDNMVRIISPSEMFCHIDMPQRHAIAIAIPAIAAPVFFLTFRSEKINIFARIRT
tara:strand:- start:397 stop:597 length:201 start_codon:yes stop_codon:yes gene_type:complete